MTKSSEAANLPLDNERFKSFCYSATIGVERNKLLTACERKF